jgi:hypothetical protein
VALSFLVLLGAAVGIYIKRSPKPQPPIEPIESTPSSGNPAKDESSFEFEPAGNWLVSAGGAASGMMRLNLKKNQNYEITNASGALQIMAQTLGGAGTWTFNTTDKRLVLLPTNSPISLGIRITGKQQNSFSATSNDGVFYTFDRQ